jgi:hypothetical protein
MSLPREITLRLLLEKPTTGVDFGLQEGRGSSYQVVQKQRSDGHDLTFEFSVTVKIGKDGAPDFAGPIVQGSAGERFLLHRHRHLRGPGKHGMES